MAVVKPFRGVMYNPEVVGGLGMNFSPPFDAMSPQLEEELLQRSPFNIVRLERVRRDAAGGSVSYQTAADIQKEWIAANALIRSPVPSMYILEEDFEHEGKTLTRRGVIAAVRLQEYSDRVVFPHERTRAEWVEDRVRLMQVARSVYSSLIAVAGAGTPPALSELFHRTNECAPYFSATVPGMTSLRLWRVDDADILSDVSADFADSEIIIADGHHRYEAALKYRALCQKGQSELGDHVAGDSSYMYRMMLLISSEEPGLITRGFHRTVSGLSSDSLDALIRKVFTVGDAVEWIPPAGRFDSLEIASLFSRALEQENGDIPTFGMATRRSSGGLDFWVVRMREHFGKGASDIVGNSDYVVLHREVLEPMSLGESNPDLGFEHNLPQLLTLLSSGEIQVAFMMRPLPMNVFTEIALQGVRLPPKVTNFYPKPPAGCVIQSLEGRL